MAILEILIRAIREAKSISFEYNKIGKTPGKRIGNPHAIFILTSKADVKSTKVHIVQVDGVSDTVDKNPFPEFRMFNIEELSNVQIIESMERFTAHEKYNPEWEGYKDVIEKL